VEEDADAAQGFPRSSLVGPADVVLLAVIVARRGRIAAAGLGKILFVADRWSFSGSVDIVQQPETENT
jgi:hypothetical protein